MGQYLIAGATSVEDCSSYAPGEGRTWTLQQGGVLFTDPNLSDGQCEAVYASFTPQPAEVYEHLQHLRDYLVASSPTNAETVHVVKDIIRALRYVNGRLD